MQYKSFPAPFFNHFIQPSPPPIAKLKSLHGVSSGQRPHKNSPIPLWVAPHMVTEISPKFNMILDNQSRLALNNKKIPLPDEPQKCLGFVHKQLLEEVFCKRSCS